MHNFRMFIANELMNLTLSVLPKPEQAEFAAVVHPLLRQWMDREGAPRREDSQP